MSEAIMADEEFLSAIKKLQIDMLYQKAIELTKRPARRADQLAYERKLAAKRRYDEKRANWNKKRVK